MFFYGSISIPGSLPLAFSLLIPALASADDWPQWNGPTRDGVVHEAGITTVIPEGGLKLLWRSNVGLGYSGPAIVDDRVYVCDYVKASGEVKNNAGSRDKLTGQERLICFDAMTGRELWTYKYDRPYAISYGSGPRATPTVHQGCVYLLGAEGDLTCLDAKSGEQQWSRSFQREFSAPTPMWGHSASPLVYKDSLICLVGGSGSLVVAFDIKSGKEKWRALDAKEIGYCPPSLIVHGGVEQLLVWDPQKLSSMNPNTGSVYWQEELKPAYGMSILPPIKEGDLLYAGGEGSIGAMFRLDRGAPQAELAWKGTPKTGVYLATSSAIFDHGHLYGADIHSGALVCVRATSGERLWQSALPTTGSARGRGQAHGTAYLLKVNEAYLILSETGDLISAKLSPSGYEETGRFQAIAPTGKAMGRDYVWTFPAISNGRLYLRNDQEVKCFDVSRKD